ncbi:hypothetical protein K239x_33280 [Planctomycetes bacterium K23_9]|uniref:Uncharacterized protein n=1 Tax=Stieleria marina TaxID=1930275 RepID=A0A517NW22_9BACT|nr:hypothetical protein K239x_33280 [Planctomycetes bacterium K23_9]
MLTSSPQFERDRLFDIPVFVATLCEASIAVSSTDCDDPADFVKTLFWEALVSQPMCLPLFIHEFAAE